MGVIKTSDGYEFFASDGGQHSRQSWQGDWVGNNKSGSVVTTVGTPALGGASSDLDPKSAYQGYLDIGAFKAHALPGGPWRLAVRAVKGVRRGGRSSELKRRLLSRADT
jgi:hypothetical protein